MSVKSTEVIENASNLLERAMNLMKDDKNKSAIRFTPLMPKEISRLAQKAKNKVGMLQKNNISEIMEVPDEKDSDDKTKNSPEKPLLDGINQNPFHQNYRSPGRVVDETCSLRNFPKTDLKKIKKVEHSASKSQYSENRYDRRRIVTRKSHDRISFVADSVDFGTNIFISYLLHAIEIERLVHMNKEQIKEAEEMENEIDALEHERNLFKKENLKLRNKMVEMTRTKKNLEEKNEILTEEISKLKNGIQSNRLSEAEAVVALKSEIRVLMSKLQASGNNSKLFKEENVKLETSLKHYKKQAEKLKDMEKIQFEYEDLKKKYSELEVQLDKIITKENNELKKGLHFESELKKLKLRHLKSQNLKLIVENENRKLQEKIEDLVSNSNQTEGKRDSFENVELESRKKSLVTEILNFGVIYDSQTHSERGSILKPVNTESSYPERKKKTVEVVDLRHSSYTNHYIKKSKKRQDELKKEIKNARRERHKQSTPSNKNQSETFSHEVDQAELEMRKPVTANILSKTISQSRTRRKKNPGDISKREEEIKSSISQRIKKLKQMNFSKVGTNSPSSGDNGTDRLKQLHHKIKREKSAIRVKKPIIIKGTTNKSAKFHRGGPSIDLNARERMSGDQHANYFHVFKSKIDNSSAYENKLKGVQAKHYDRGPIEMNFRRYDSGTATNPRVSEISNNTHTGESTNTRLKVRDNSLANAQHFQNSPHTRKRMVKTHKIGGSLRNFSHDGSNSQRNVGKDKPGQNPISLNQRVKGTNPHRIRASYYIDAKKSQVAANPYMNEYSSYAKKEKLKLLAELRDSQKSDDASVKLLSRTNSRSLMNTYRKNKRSEVSTDQSKYDSRTSIKNRAGSSNFTSNKPGSNYGSGVKPPLYSSTVMSSEINFRKMTMSNYIKDQASNFNRTHALGSNSSHKRSQVYREPSPLSNNVFKT